ncbi:MAG: DUF2330 domain-containing protein [Kofleriaceae bacterium]|nr:DUF2330 domain-containing protein [Kofleriaceae bacterium]MBP9171554.1 DUF2330 domain-containing protein [Kofleriaceae bacterium]MBP9860201.1 DUF2330 domain-containing protein [Kofleriaceae bacterium]
MRTSALLVAAALALAPTSAHAFCGFYVGGADANLYNHATQVVLMRHGSTTVLSMVNNYQGPPEAFAMVVPVPVVVREADVKTLDRALLTKVDTLGAPRLVEYWEQDPCRVPEPVMALERMSVDDESDDRSPPSDDDADYQVKVEARFSVGEYDVVVLSAGESTGLERWLRDHRYTIPAKAEPLLRPYVEAGTKFFVAKVDPKKVRFVDGMATLSPLRVAYDSTDFALPIRLGLANAAGKQDLIVNILAPGNTRYEVANYPNATIPTNLIVKDEVRGRFGEFYAALLDHAQARVPGAVITEYAWDASSCDPCPGPTLDGDDLATLGADVITANYQDVDPWGFTLTRLHARYGDELGDDLVFRAVEPIAGGQGTPDADGALPTEVMRGAGNAFQGRYVILHPWTQEVTCADPHRGRWGGPPLGAQLAGAGLQAATDTAFAPRGKLDVAALVARPVPEIGPLTSGGAGLPTPLRKGSGCACDAGTAGAGGAVGLGLVTLLAAIRRPRRRRP